MKTTAIIKNGKPVLVQSETKEENSMKRVSNLSNSSNAKIQALTERNEFLEDLIAELAVQIYSTPPNV